MKVLVLDVEGTIFETNIRLPSTQLSSTVWQTIAQLLGPEAVLAEVETHRKWHRGEYRSYLDWMKDTIKIHQRYGLTSSLFHQIISSAQYNVGVEETLRLLDRNRFEVLLVSGGFRELAMRAQQDFQISHAFTACEYIFSPDGALTGYNLLPCDFHGKIDFIRLMLREYGMAESDWCFVGDGLNDVPVAKEAPLSVAFKACEELSRASTHSIRQFTDLLQILNKWA